MLRTNTYFLSFAESLANKNEAVAASLKRFAAGERMMVQDKTARQVFIIKEGICKCFRSEENGKELIFEFLGKGEMIGDLEAILNTACLCNIETINTVEAYCFSTTQFNKFLETEKVFQKKVMEELALRLKQTAARASYQQTYPVEYSLLKFLLVQKEQNLSFNKRDIAAYLAITIRSLNRAVKQLRERNIINAEGLKLDISRKELEQLLLRLED